MSEGLGDRTAMMIHQLTRASAEQLESWQSAPGRIAVAISKKSIMYRNAELCLAMVVNTLARVHPVVTSIHIIVPDGINRKINAPLFEGDDLKSCIESFVEKLRPSVNVQVKDSPEGDYDAVLSIGNTEMSHEFKVCMASDGWVAYVGRDNLFAEFTDNFNPIGAYLAASVGSVEAFKKIFVKKADIINPERSDYDFRWNVRLLDGKLKFNGFDYSVNSNSPNPHLPDVVDLGEPVIAGTGAGGGAGLYVLASLPRLRGTLHLIDPDEVKPSNLNRYVYAVQADADGNRPKVNVIEQLLAPSQTTVRKYHMPYAQFSKTLNGKSVELIVSTVDTSGTRVDIQWDLPRIILDAAVAGTQFYIKKVELGKTPCLGCTHYPQDFSDSIESRLSNVIGLSAAVITELRKNNQAFEEEHIQLMKPFGEKYGFQLPNTGEHFQDWHLYHCGQIPLGQSEIQIPVPFATIIPGILLAGEIIKQRHFGDYIIRNYFSYDIFGMLRDVTEVINRRPDCPICSDPTTVARYKKKHALGI